MLLYEKKWFFAKMSITNHFKDADIFSKYYFFLVTISIPYRYAYRTFLICVSFIFHVLYISDTWNFTVFFLLFRNLKESRWLARLDQHSWPPYFSQEQVSPRHHQFLIIYLLRLFFGLVGLTIRRQQYTAYSVSIKDLLR